MAKSSGNMPTGQILEGFLCPMCMCDLKTSDQLQEHFELMHSSEDNDVLQTLKGIFGKAKRKIMKQDTNCLPEEFQSFSLDNTLDSPSVSWSPQEMGHTSSHTKYFKSLREKKIHGCMIETNKLIIRLGKFVGDLSEDPEKRKDLERNIAPWVPDADVPLCPGCAKSFGISRRRHHCRLCGGVMCHSCSSFINFDFARKLTLPAGSDSEAASAQMTPTPRASSLMSIVNSPGEHLIRICKDCHQLLLRRDYVIEHKNHKPVVVVLYERLKSCTDEIEKLVPFYLDMMESLSLGETKHSLQSAQELKMKISKLAERTDALSKRITKLESGEGSNSRASQLHNGIRLAASQFLQGMVLTLPAIPSTDELKLYQNKRQAQLQERIQQEKQAEVKSIRDLNRSPSSDPPALKPRISKMEPVSPNTGWCVSPNKVSQDDDPMVQQIANILNYIEQAKKDNKEDEVRTLEQNLQVLYEAQNKASMSR